MEKCCPICMGALDEHGECPAQFYPEPSEYDVREAEGTPMEAMLIRALLHAWSKLIP